MFLIFQGNIDIFKQETRYPCRSFPKKSIETYTFSRIFAVAYKANERNS